VLYGWASFEEVPPSLQVMTERRARVLAEGMPYYVAELDGVVVGYAYATIYRTRSAYRFTAEDSIYISHEYARRGIGSALLTALIDRCETMGCRQMIAVISDTEGGSIPLHTRFGFRPAGTLEAVGWKFDRWIDTVRLQRALGPGSTQPPSRVPQ
jgi:phosphinothricin acetyltransferase